MNFENDEVFGAKAPGPITVAVFLMAGLVGIDVRLLGQQGQQLRVGLGEGLGGFLIQFGQVTAGNLQAQHVAKEVLDA